MEYAIDTMVDSLEQAVSEPLENLVFLEVDNVENLDVLPEIKPQDFVVSLKTLEPFSETVYFVFAEDFANEVVCEMAGVPDGNFADDIMKDALGELTNTMVGRFMAKLVPDDQVFELDLPESARYSSLKNELPQNAKVRILLFKIQGFQMYALLEEYSD